MFRIHAVRRARAAAERRWSARAAARLTKVVPGPAVRGRRSARVVAGTALLSLGMLGCASRGRATGRPGGGAPEPHGRAPSDSVRPGILQAYRDSAQQAQIGAFIRVYQSRSRGLDSAGNYLGEISVLEGLVADLPGNPTVAGFADQLIGTNLSFLGRWHDALERFAAIDGAGAANGDSTHILRYAVGDAVPAILALADTAHVIFINEAHHVPQTRLLTLALLRGLRERGYTYFAAETFAETDSGLNTRGYPVHGTGFYTNEPVFGELVRTASRLGYTLVPYEAVNPKDQNAREHGEAANLVERIFRDHPGAKVIVHAGYDHIHESGKLGGADPMAVQFRALTGIDPVTIDQTTMRERADSSREYAAYRVLLRSRALTGPAVLRDSTGRLWSARPGVTDVTVVLPRTRLVDGRPDWLWTVGGDRRALSLPGDVCGATPRCVAAARLSGEAGDAVPIDRLLIDRGTAPPPLLLPRGRYRLTVTDAAGDTLREKTTTVP